MTYRPQAPPGAKRRSPVDSVLGMLEEMDETTRTVSSRRDVRRPVRREAVRSGSVRNELDRRDMQENLRRFKAGVFQALANPTRIAIIELLRDEGEVPVSTVHARLGLEQANVSQHLAVLRAKHIVVARKDGNQVFYSLRDRVIGKILDLMRQYFHAHLEESFALLEGMRTDRDRQVKTTRERDP